MAMYTRWTKVVIAYLLCGVVTVRAARCDGRNGLAAALDHNGAMRKEVCQELYSSLQRLDLDMPKGPIKRLYCHNGRIGIITGHSVGERVWCSQIRGWEIQRASSDIYYN
jgi:hypothetical protein